MLEDIQNSKELQWLSAFLIAFIISFAAKAALTFIAHRLNKVIPRIKGILDDVIVDCLNLTRRWTLFWVIFYPLSQNIEANSTMRTSIFAIFVVSLAFQIASWGLRLINIWRDDVLNRKVSPDGGTVSAIKLFSTAVQGLLLIAIVLMTMSNLGVNVGALIAGLGVGGIAVALAAQNILGDLFASLSIVFDKPFVIGDFIVVGQEAGTVENIGVKTTRVRSLSGEELIFSNKDLLESRVKNFKRMWQRRVVLKFNVPYVTASDRLEQIPKWVQSYINSESLLSFDRCHLQAFGDYALTFETVFWVKDPDYNKFMDLQQSLMLKIINQLRMQNIPFAVPTRNLQVDIADFEIEPELEEDGLRRKDDELLS